MTNSPDDGSTEGDVESLSRRWAELKSREERVAQFQQDILLFEVLMDVLPDSIYFKDTDCRFRRANYATSAKFNLPGPEAVLGKTDFDIFSPEHASEAYEDETRIMETGIPVIGKEEKETWPDGRVSWVSTTKVRVEDRDGKVLGTFGVTRDITRRKQALDALEISEKRYRDLIENANDIIYTHDLHGRLISINRAAEVASEYTQDEAKSMSVEDIVAPEYLNLAQDMTRRKLRGIATTTYEIELLSKSGKRVPLELSTQVLFHDGKPMSVLGIGRDVTERKRAEATQQEQSRLLELRNRDLSKAYRELQDAETQLIHSEKMAAIGQLVAGLAHEINNPAAFVLTNLTTIERDVADLLEYVAAADDLADAVVQEYPQEVESLREVRRRRAVDEAVQEAMSLLASCRSGMHRIRDLVANLRSYSRIDARGKFEFVDLAQGVEATLVLLRPLIPKTVEINVHMNNIPSVECNLGHINQVFMNLIVNAVDAVRDRPASSPPGVVDISAQRSDEGVLIRVRDNGIGISPEDRSRIFDPFFTTKEVGKGTGLGLTICQRIIEAHHGNIDLESQLGHGTEFRLWLPISQPSSP